jgi:hypothetical protein
VTGADLAGLAVLARSLLAFDRETLMISALVALTVAGVVVSFTAWMLLARERRAGRRSGATGTIDEGEPAVATGTAQPPSAAP